MSKPKGYLKRIARVDVPKGAGVQLAGIITGPVVGDAIDRTVEYRRWLDRTKRRNVYALVVSLDHRARILHVGDNVKVRNELAAVAYGLAKETIRLSEECDETAVAAVGIAYRCAGWCGWKSEAVDVLRMFGQKASARALPRVVLSHARQDHPSAPDRANHPGCGGRGSPGTSG